MNKKKSEEISPEIIQWLDSLKYEVPTATDRHRAAAGDQLMQRAAKCYARAGWADDACRLFQSLGDFRSAASYQERQGRWLEAAACYSSAGEWQSAARCFLKRNRYSEAAQCLEKAGDKIHAAWLWAHHLHRFQYAQTIAANQKPGTNAEANHLSIQLVLARCGAGLKKKVQAAKQLHQVITTLRTLALDMNRNRLNQWAFAVADSLQRPDLTVLIHAASVSSQVPEATEQWETWAIDILGDAAGIPLTEINDLPRTNRDEHQ
jgi:tetratricopeptide (TPR) repeat protein